MTDLKNIALAISMGLTTIFGIYILSSIGPHTPSEPGTADFFATCHEVGFTERQCNFFRYGPRLPEGY